MSKTSATTVTVPYLDQDGTLTPLVTAAIEAGATATAHDTDSSMIVLAFAKDADAKAFAKAAKLDPAKDEAPEEPEEPATPVE